MSTLGYLSLAAGFLMRFYLDTILLREGLKLARTLGQTLPLKTSIDSELSPGSDVTSDSDWDAWLKGQVGTE